MTTSTAATGGRRHTRRNRLIGITAIATAGAVLASLAFAYFSDSINVGAQGTSGTLDLVQTTDNAFTVEQTDGVTVDSFVPVTETNEAGIPSAPNFNPGDVLKMSGTVMNEGNKSAWIRVAIDYSHLTVDPAIAPYLYVFAAENVPTQADLLALDTTADENNDHIPDCFVDPDTGTPVHGFVGSLETLASGNAGLETSGHDPYDLAVTSLTKVISGDPGLPNSEDDGTTAKANGAYPVTNTDGQYSAQAVVYFDPLAPNSAMGKAFTIGGSVQAIQYRNNTDLSAVDWSLVSTPGTFVGSTWTPDDGT